jgi:hypothetical protein
MGSLLYLYFFIKHLIFELLIYLSILFYLIAKSMTINFIIFIISTITINDLYKPKFI